MSNKRYYWLKLKDDFFEDDTIAWLEEQENGKDYVLFYLKLALKSLSEEGSLIRYVGERLIPYDTKALAKLTNTPVDTVAVAMKVFGEIGLVSVHETGEIYMNQINEMIGSETRQASIMRKNRVKENKIKKIAEQGETSIPYIENYTNQTRYGGNYYVVFDRDNRKCVSCGSQDNLCVHHIIGYDKGNPVTSERSNLITLCRSCHSKEHGKPYSIMTNEMLENVKFDFNNYDLISQISNTNGKRKQPSNIVTKSYKDVNKGYTEIEKDIEIDIDKEDKRVQTYPFVLKNNKDYFMEIEYFNQLKTTYPNVDLDIEFKKMQTWLLSNADKRKTDRGMPRFINSWLSRVNDRPKDNKVNQEMPIYSKEETMDHDEEAKLRDEIANMLKG